jgi:hypothetical protein
MVSQRGSNGLGAMTKIGSAIDLMNCHRRMLSDMLPYTRWCRKSNILIRLTHVASETGSRISR